MRIVTRLILLVFVMEMYRCSPCIEIVSETPLIYNNQVTSDFLKDMIMCFGLVACTLLLFLVVFGCCVWCYIWRQRFIDAYTALFGRKQERKALVGRDETNEDNGLAGIVPLAIENNGVEVEPPNNNTDTSSASNVRVVPNLIQENVPPGQSSITIVRHNVQPIRVIGVRRKIIDEETN